MSLCRFFFSLACASTLSPLASSSSLCPSSSLSAWHIWDMVWRFSAVKSFVHCVFFSLFRIFALLLCSLRLLVYSPFSINFGAKLSVYMGPGCVHCAYACSFDCAVCSLPYFICFTSSIYLHIHFFFSYLLPLHCITITQLLPDIQTKASNEIARKSSQKMLVNLAMQQLLYVAAEVVMPSSI